MNACSSQLRYHGLRSEYNYLTTNVLGTPKSTIQPFTLVDMLTLEETAASFTSIFIRFVLGLVMIYCNTELLGVCV